MSNKGIEDIIKNSLHGDTQQNALDFIEYLKENNMIAGGEHGAVSYNDQPVCYMHIDSSEDMPGPWTIWTEGDYSGENVIDSVDEHDKEIAWEHVNYCGNCGGNCSPGIHKVIFGKEFDNVCNADMAFYMPNAETLECVKKLLLMRKNYIDSTLS